MANIFQDILRYLVFDVEIRSVNSHIEVSITEEISQIGAGPCWSRCWKIFWINATKIFYLNGMTKIFQSCLKENICIFTDLGQLWELEQRLARLWVLEPR